MKKEPLFIVLIVLAAVAALYDLAYIIFGLCQLVMLGNATAFVLPVLSPMSITAIAVNGVFLAYSGAYLIFRRS